MFKLANQVLDAHDDIDRSILKKIATKNPSIYMMTEEEKQGLSDDDFALCVITKKASKLNKFPINDSDSTWLSNEYFNETYNSLTKEAAQIAAYNIKQACERYNVKPTPAVIGLAKEASTNIYYEGDITAKNISVVEEDLSKYAQVSKICDSYTHAQYVFNNPQSIKTASEYFKQFSDKMPVELRHKYASALQRRAGELGVTITDPAVCKYASNAYSAHLDAHLASRRDILQIKEAKYTEALNKLASMRNEVTPMEFAQVLHSFDKRAGIDRYYGGYLTNPYEATFASMANPKLMKVGSKTSMTPEALSRVFTEKYAKLKEYFGQHLADSLKKEGSAAFEALPNDAKEIIAGIADGTL
jgi:hypothetical protein